MRFFLGTHQPNWLTLTAAALFVSDRRLRRYRRSLPTALGSWSLDSGGFTELQQYGTWDHGPTPCQYAERVRRYRDEIGGLVWAAPQDWMCEPIVLSGGTAGPIRFAGTGLSVAEHQRRTVSNLLELRAIAPDLPFIPVLQGYTLTEYLTCIDRYHDAGVDLAAEPTVGIGSVCRREATAEAAEIIHAVSDRLPGIRLHGFGIKTSGLGAYGSLLASSDSMAWSAAARYSPSLPGCTHTTCANCPKWAFRWRERVLASLGGHATRTHPGKRASLSRKLDSPHAVRLRLSTFRDEAARIERDTTIRWAHRDGGLSVRAIATRTGLSPARVGQILTHVPTQPLGEQLRDLRAQWEVDADPASRAAADQIVAHLTTDDLMTPTS